MESTTKPAVRTQAVMETQYSGHNVRWILSEAIEKELDNTLFEWTVASAIKLDIYLNDGYDDKYYASKNQRIKALKPWLDKKGLNHLLVIGSLAGAMPHTENMDAEKTAAELIAVCSSSSKDGLYGIYPYGSGRMTMINSIHWGLFDKIFEDAYSWINETGFNPPLVERPAPVTDNTSNGYHTVKVPVLSGGRLKQHDQKLNLKCINILNSIRWKLDMDVLKEPMVVPEKFNVLQQKTHQEYITDTRRVQDILRDEPFWFSWQYDFRGRCYTHGYHINLQSFAYNKAVLNLDKAEYLN